MYPFAHPVLRPSPYTLLSSVFASIVVEESASYRCCTLARLIFFFLGCTCDEGLGLDLYYRVIPLDPDCPDGRHFPPEFTLESIKTSECDTFLWLRYHILPNPTPFPRLLPFSYRSSSENSFFPISRVKNVLVRPQLFY